MKKINYLFVAGALVLFSAFTITRTMNLKVAENHAVKFSGTEVEGIFKTLNGDVTFDANNLSSSKFTFTIDVNSINTGNGMKNKHAVSDKWFDAEKYPTISFVSSQILKDGNQLKVKGAMKIHGITKEMTIPFTYNNNTIATKFSVNRLDFKIGTMKGMSKKVSDKIDLDVTIPLKK